HLREHHRRHEVRDHALAGDVRPVLERDALYLIVLHVDLRDLGVVPDVAALLPDAPVEGQGYLVAAHFADIGLEIEVHPEHLRVDGEAHLGGVHADVVPVALVDMPRLLRHAELYEHLVRRHGYAAHEVGPFQEHGQLGRVVVVLVEPVHPIAYHPRELHEVLHGGAAARHGLFHRVEEALLVRGYGHVVALFRLGAYGAEGLVHRHPLHVE